MGSIREYELIYSFLAFTTTKQVSLRVGSHEVVNRPVQNNKEVLVGERNFKLKMLKI